MKVHELEKGSIYSNDGGVSWWVVLSEPKDNNPEDPEDDLMKLFVSSVEDCRDVRNVKLYSYDYVWEPNPEDVRVGAKVFRVKEEEIP